MKSQERLYRVKYATQHICDETDCIASRSLLWHALMVTSRCEAQRTMAPRLTRKETREGALKLLDQCGEDLGMNGMVNVI